MFSAWSAGAQVPVGSRVSGQRLERGGRLGAELRGTARAALVFLSACFILQVRAEAQIKETRYALFLEDLGTLASPGFSKIVAAVSARPQEFPLRIAFHGESLEIDAFPGEAFLRRFAYSVHKPEVVVVGSSASLNFIPVMLDRPTGFQGLYKQYFWLAILAILAQMLAILALLWQRSRRKKVELDLVRTNDRLRSAMESGKSAGWEFDLASRKTRWFGDLQTMFGTASNAFMGQVEDFYQSVHPEDRERVSKALAKARDNHEPYHQEFRILRSDGTARWVASSGEFEYTASGKALVMRGMAVDVTERKQLDEALRI